MSKTKLIFGIRLLRFFCPSHLLEEIEGDLLQKFERDLKLFGERKAKRRSLWNAIRFFRPEILFQHKRTSEFISLMMWHNYLKITFRTLERNKLYSFINVFGLAAGIVSSILILLWVQYQYSFNHFAANHSRIYQVKVNMNYNGTISTDEGNPIPVYTFLKTENSMVKKVCFTSNTFGHLLTFKDKKTNKEVMSVSNEFLDLFGMPLIRGNSHSLDDPYSIMLNESTAKELFGDKDPINEFVKIDNEHELKITGVFKDVPRNSTFWFHALIPTGYYDRPNHWVGKDREKWDNFYPLVYLELQSNVSEESFNEQIHDLVRTHFDDGTHPELFTQAMDRWYLYDKFEDGKEAGGKIEYVRLFTWIALFTLLIACINYMNMATARSQRRAKEIGIRKTIGSNKGEIIRQFLFESFVISFFSIMIALVVILLVLPYFNNIIHEQLTIDFDSTSFWLLLLAVFVVTVLLAGCYPALYFSSLQPVSILKGISKTSGTLLPRKVLMTFQNVVAIVLVLGMLVIYKQIQHVKNRTLGYYQQNLICYAVNEQMEKNYAAIKNELLQSGVVEAVTIANQGIDVDYFTDYVEWEGKQIDGKVIFTRLSTQYDYTTTHHIGIIMGRDFSPEFRSDSNAVLINKTAMELMGMKDPIGKKIHIREGEKTIIGVTEDVLRSPFEPIRPLYMGMLKDGNNHLSIRLKKTDDLGASIKITNEVFKKLDPLNVDEPEFVDTRFAWNFRSMEMVGELSSLFSLLAVLLTGLGVFGLAAYTAEQRMKEIAIRKIMGASLHSLLLLLSNYFTRIVLLSIAIATPLAWWLADGYLQNYSYRIDIPWWAIPLTSLGILALTLFIVFTQVVRTASINPVNSLKNE